MMKIFVSPTVMLVIFVDDIVVMAKQAAELVAAKHALFVGYDESPAGNFFFKSSSQTFASGIEFLGYELKYDGQKLKIKPSLFNQFNFVTTCGKHEGNIKKAFKKKKSGHNYTRKAIAEYLCFRCGWLNSFKAVSDIKERAGFSMNIIVAICNNHGEFPISVMKCAKNSVSVPSRKKQIWSRRISLEGIHFPCRTR
jgi:hypothetical protein